MIVLDTNVLVRYVTQDDPEQAGEASQLIETYDSVPNSILIPNEVIIETVWVLESSYKRARIEIQTFLHQMAQVESFTFQDDDLVREAIEAFGATRLDMADILLALLARKNKANLVTFDKGLRDTFPQYTAKPLEAIRLAEIQEERHRP
jgi:predicted nucleic-acid-binding protein